MQTFERSLTNAVKRFVRPICDLAETRAPRPVREGNQRLRHSKCLSPSLTGTAMAQRKRAKRRQTKPRQNLSQAPEGSGFFPVVTSNLLSMVGVTAAFATVLAVLLGVAKLT